MQQPQILEYQPINDSYLQVRLTPSTQQQSYLVTSCTRLLYVRISNGVHTIQIMHSCVEPAANPPCSMLVIVHA